MMPEMVSAQLKRMLAPLLAALFVLLLQPAFAHPVHAGHKVHHSHARHHASTSSAHHTLTVSVETLRTHAKQAKAHKAITSHTQRGPAGSHHAAHAVLQSRPHGHLVRHASPRNPIARHLAPNAPPMVFGDPITSALLSSLTTYRLRVGHLRPSLGRAPPVLL